MCYIYIWLSAMSGQQIQIALIVNLGVMILQNYNRPYKIRLLNRLSLFNNMMVILITYPLILFSDFANNKEFQYHYGGWSWIITLLVILLVNLLVVWMPLYAIIKIIVIKYYRILEAKFAKTRLGMYMNARKEAMM